MEVTVHYSSLLHYRSFSSGLVKLTLSALKKMDFTDFKERFGPSM